MAGLNGTLEIAKNTLLNTQAHIQTTSHNIANADNKAYARQKVIQVTSIPLLTRAGFLGTGASLEKIVQQRDGYLEQRLISSQSKEAFNEAKATQLRITSGYLADDGESGISGALGEFWDAWDALNKNPSGSAERTVVEESVKNLAQSIRDAYSQLESQSLDIEKEVQDRTNKAQGLMDDIAKYNEQITIAEFQVGQPANDLRDKRYQALMDLSALIPIEFEEQTNGSVTVTMQSSPPDPANVELVSGDTANTLGYDTATNEVSVTSASGSDSFTSLEGGEIAGLIDSIEKIGTPPGSVPSDPEDSSLSYIDRLNAFADSLISQVNPLHTSGGVGSNIFSGTTAADIDIWSTTPFTLDPDQALAISELQNQSSTIGTGTFGDYLSNIQNQIGLDVEGAQNQTEFYASLGEQLLSEQQSISGVSIDEEMVELLKQQQIYQAAAKLVQHSADMLNAVINMV
jgi:flagellar hook-associated protein 1